MSGILLSGKIYSRNQVNSKFFYRQKNVSQITSGSPRSTQQDTV